MCCWMKIRRERTKICCKIEKEWGWGGERAVDEEKQMRRYSHELMILFFNLFLSLDL